MCKSPFVKFCVSIYKKLNEEKTLVVDYVFDESSDPRSIRNHKFNKHCSYNTMIMDLFPKKQKQKISWFVFLVINSEVICAYGGYGVTRKQFQCLAEKGFIDISVSFMINKEKKTPNFSSIILSNEETFCR